MYKITIQQLAQLSHKKAPHSPLEKPSYEVKSLFWNELKDYLVKNGNGWAASKTVISQSLLRSPAIAPGVNVNISFAMDSRIRVEIYFKASHRFTANELYQVVYKMKTDIERLFDRERVHWEPVNEGKRTKECRVAVYYPFDIKLLEDSRGHRTQLFDWINRDALLMQRVATQYFSHLDT